MYLAKPQSGVPQFLFNSFYLFVYLYIYIFFLFTIIGANRFAKQSARTT